MEIVNAYYKDSKESLKPKDIITLVKNVHKVSITYWKSWHGRKLAHDLLKGLFGIEFPPSSCVLSHGKEVES